MQPLAWPVSSIEAAEPCLQNAYPAMLDSCMTGTLLDIDIEFAQKIYISNKNSLPPPKLLQFPMKIGGNNNQIYTIT